MPYYVSIYGKPLKALDLRTLDTYDPEWREKISSLPDAYVQVFDDTIQLVGTPTEDLEDAMLAGVVLKPSRNAEQCPNFLYDDWAEYIAAGALAKLHAMSNKIPFSQLTPLLDLVAVSIASDIVPITGENRIMAYHGLKQINSNPSIGLKSIIDLCGLTDKEILISDIVFKIGPRINASGRMQSGNEAVELLIAKDVSFAKEKSPTNRMVVRLSG